MICPKCTGYGYISEHTGDASCQMAECSNCPEIVQCDNCQATGEIINSK